MTLSQRTDSSDQTEEGAPSRTRKIPYHFGEKLREAREHMGYTLKIVAQRAGVSESLVSQIERNHVSPAIDTLLALADVLDINLEYLFEEYRKERPVQIVHANERASLTEEDVLYEELAKASNSEKTTSIEAYLIKMPAGTTTHRGSYGHIGREIGIIIKGRARLLYDNKEYILDEGDSVSFSAAAPHVLENIGSQELQAIWTVTPAQRFSEK